MADVKFLFDNQLIAELENLIKNSKNRLLLISPFIDLDKRIQDALREKLSKYDFQLQVLFGKNEDNLYKSLKKDSFEFLKQFPNIEIRYNDRLHAKFYLNDFDFMLTSINLYDFSLAKNIEVGVLYNYAAKGLLGKVIDGTDSFINQGIEKVRQDVLGFGNEIDPIQKFQTIFENSELKYKTEPIIVEQDGIKGLIGGKRLNGFNIKIDNLIISAKETKSQKQESVSNTEPGYKPIKKEYVTQSSSKTLSASQLCKSLGLQQAELLNLMQKSGLINGAKITDLGLSKGLVMKNYMGKDYISYPDNLAELKHYKPK